MTYKENTKSTIASVISTGEHTELRIARVESESGEYLGVDIRTWYNTSKDPEMKPTVKGVRLYKEYINQVLQAIEVASN